ncbi:unnamed protein product [Paramecium sonneborni]|uniref:Uncharacterized protein n=1 Tax=Paramecium sonneborni TaxID=65129 RepID=A0A8S1L6D4_9CILI|nr:unnamed protein product [Paramecium sonneborni]
MFKYLILLWIQHQTQYSLHFDNISNLLVNEAWDQFIQRNLYLFHLNVCIYGKYLSFMYFNLFQRVQS